ncbi:DNA mismatch repair protein MutS [Cupriavidus necator H850]|nr:DNA mismatch repair protein MutS [Cupriavidus necator H850]
MGLQKKTDPEQAQADSAASRHTPMMQQHLCLTQQDFLD